MRLSSTFALLFAASPLVAQARDVCPNGPGAAFGIVAYQCANCGFKQDQRPTYSFFAEPVVVEVNGKTGVTAGDVVEAVNGKPITTTAGAEAFSYPATGENSITIRRGRERQVVRVSVSSACGSKNQIRLPLTEIENVEVLKGTAAALRYGPDAADAGVVVITTKGGQSMQSDTLPLRLRGDTLRLRLRGEVLSALRRPRGSEPLLVIDGVVMGRTLPEPMPLVGRFGFGFTCEPRCSVWTGRDGPLIYTYYRYRDFPPITAIGPGSAAERAGLKAGDLVVKVEGHSVLDDEGAKGLARLDRVEVLHLTVRRDGKEIDYTLRLADKPD
jgi:hypothetical protein